MFAMRNMVKAVDLVYEERVPTNPSHLGLRLGHCLLVFAKAFKTERML